MNTAKIRRVSHKWEATIDVTISKFRFSIDFDSIFSPKSRFRLDLILITPMLNIPDKIPTKLCDNRRRAVVFKATYCLYKTRGRLLIDVTWRRTYQQTTHCPWPVTNPPRIWHLQTSKWQVTTMFPRSHLSRTTHQQHSQKLDVWHWRKLLLLANSSVNDAIAFQGLKSSRPASSFT